MADPFLRLHADDTPVAPSPTFAARLRERLAALDTEEPTMSDPAPTSARPIRPAPTIAAPDLTASHSITPYLVVSDAAAAIDFYVEVLGAVEHHRLLDGDRIGHAEFVVGDSRLAIADEYPEYGIVGPNALGGSPVSLMVLVADADAVMATAVAAGGTELRAAADQFHGHRTGQFRDPWGHRWTVSAPIHDRYEEEATAEGFTYVPSDALVEATADAAPGHHDHQVKHHDRGDLYYFTLPTADLERAQRFFGALLGWDFGGSLGGHVENISAPPGGLNPGTDEVILWFAVDDIHAAVAQVRSLGGTAEEPVHYDSGWSAMCTDDQGTRFALSVPTYTR